MTFRRSAATVALAGVGIATGFVLTAGSASAATPVPYEPDANSYGTISFYDASGNQITSGTITDSPIAAYAVGSAPGRSGDTGAGLKAAQPDPAKSTALYNVDSLSAATTYPLTTGPASIQTLSQTHPVVTGSSTDLSLNDFINEFPNDPAHDSNTSYQNLYQLRLVTAAGSNQDPQYQVADVLVSGNTWTQVYPAVKANTVTTLTAAPNPANLPAGSGTSVSVTLTANVASGGSAFTAGTVQFKNGSTNIGSPVAVDSTGKASTTATFTSTGTFPLSAVFTPTDTTSYNGSTGTTSEVVTQATSTFTSLSVVQDGTAGDDVMLTANVTSGSPAAPFGAGTVAFYDNGSSTALGTGTQGSTGAFTLDLPTGLAAGSHSIVARFTPTDTATYAGSQSSAQAFVLSPKAVGACATTGSVCNDTQNIQVTVPVGTLVISTPYTSANPLDLKTMALDPSAKYLTASAGFEHIQVTDQRSGNLPYTVTASASNLSDGKSNAGSTIDAHDVGLTGLAKTSSSNLTGAVTFTDAPAANLPVAPGASSTAGLGGAGAPVISVDHGFGFLEASGTLTSNAPITTEPGLFTGTITFTVG